MLYLFHNPVELLVIGHLASCLFFDEANSLLHFFESGRQRRKAVMVRGDLSYHCRLASSALKLLVRTHFEVSFHFLSLADEATEGLRVTLDAVLLQTFLFEVPDELVQLGL